jgi:hypothetical protein
VKFCKLKLENVVTPPQKPITPKQYAGEIKNWVGIAPIMNPSKKLPVMLTVNVPKGKASPKIRDTAVMIR